MIISNSKGLSIGLLENGSIKAIEVEPIRVSLKPTTVYSKFGANIFIRVFPSYHSCEGRNLETSLHKDYIPIFGPESKSSFEVSQNSLVAKGEWNGLKYQCTLCLSNKSNTWQWKIDILNNTNNEAELDLVYLQDIGLKPTAENSINEYYVSQYLERLILEDKNYGSVVCCRQNMKGPTGNPWVVLACKNSAKSASTDGMQFYGRTYRETGIPEGLTAVTLGGEYAGESSVVALQENPFKLAVNENHTTIFIGSFLNDHPNATSIEDLKKLPKLFNEFDEVKYLSGKKVFPLKNIFNTSPLLPVEDLTKAELQQFFGKDWRHCEEENGQLLSFFYNQNSHVVLRAKEILVDRPHGHIMQAKAGFTPDENIVSTTSYAYGVFNSHLTQGNTNFNILLSVSSNQFNLTTETGQRIFVELDGHKYLLGVPSAFEIGLNYCRWIYKHGEYCIQVRTWTSKNNPQVNLDIKILNGANAKFLITHHFDEGNGWKINFGQSYNEFTAKPAIDSLITSKFKNAQFRILVQSPNSFYPVYEENESGALFILDLLKTNYFCISFLGEVCQASDFVKISNSDDQLQADLNVAQKDWQDLCLNLSFQNGDESSSAIQEVLPWFGMNAITHFLTPHGLEQFGGAAWGTRDVSQGPIDLLLHLGKYDAAKKVLCIIFSHQNPDGGWPQWWMFDSYTNIHAHEAHGDIFYWCIIALSSYIKVTGDLSILQEVLPYYHEKGTDFADKTTLSEHIERLIDMIVKSFIKGTSLVPYGGGDWNDSLQPVSKQLAERMISSWTVEMNYQAFSQYQKVYELAGNTKKADELRVISDKIKNDFQKYLVKDGVVAGYGLVEDDGSISVLLHPNDSKTNIHYSILPMNRGIISEIFTKEQALNHQVLINRHLKGPDGARLMDRPLKYNGGIQTFFQRAESSTHFGREIGLMYIHEHIRYAESQAILGYADEFVKALRQANPVAYRNIVKCGDIRQANCYYSSSDVIFKNRYDADENYNKIKSGEYTLRGGWRVYSSGPGIYIGLIVSRFIGLRTEYGNTIFDPVLPFSLNGFSASLNYLGYPITFIYNVKVSNFGPKAIKINGKGVKYSNEENTYRRGGAIIPTSELITMLNHKKNIILIDL